MLIFREQDGRYSEGRMSDIQREGWLIFRAGVRMADIQRAEQGVADIQRAGWLIFREQDD